VEKDVDVSGVFGDEHQRSSKFGYYTHSEPRFRALLTDEKVLERYTGAI
jgi:hypothetical protein